MLADRFDGGSTNSMYFFDGRHGYRFTMAAPDSDRFQAVSLNVNPTSGWRVPKGCSESGPRDSKGHHGRSTS